jgi:dipeptidyl aminopeptidase/acylaminoacyl peptidase
MFDNEPKNLTRIYAASISNKRSTLLFADTVQVRFISTQVINGQLLIALNKEDSSVFDAYRLDINSGQLRLAGKNPGSIIKWFADDFGQLRMALAGDGVSETLLYRQSEQQEFKPIITTNFETSIIPVGYGKPGTDRIYALSNLNRDKAALVEFDCTKGKETKVILSNSVVDVFEAGYSTYHHKLLYGSYEIGRKTRVYLNDSVKAVYAHLNELLPNMEVRVFDKDSVENQLIIGTYTDRSQGSFYRYVISAKKLIKIADINSSLPEKELSVMKPVSFMSRDGLKVHGYLTLPKNKVKNVPIIVMPHLSPTIRDIWGYSAQVQFLANRGYGVLQVNFRGSKGYGKQFWTAGFKELGGNVQNDLADGVMWLISQGIADKDRIGIFGREFGGYCALYGVTFNPELYKCGASVSGFCNLFSYIKRVPIDYKPILTMYYQMLGDPEKEIDRLRAASPVFYADKIKTPLFIANRTDNTVVNVNETEQFVGELKRLEAPVTYISNESSEFEMSDVEKRLEFYHEIENFFKATLK